MSLDKSLNKILIIDFGSQFTQLIARRIREIGVFCEIVSHKKIKNKDITSSIKGIILSDDENRENEGDLIYPAETMTERQMAFMIRYTSGIVCLSMTKERLSFLELPQMVSDNTSKNRTAFTISIEAKHGVTTGVSAADRIKTIKTAINPKSKPSDLARPGHVFPLLAQSGGVIERQGHTEGSLDIVEIAGFNKSAVLCELMNDDGSMMRLPEIVKFSKTFSLPILFVEDIYKFRLECQEVSA